MLECRAISGLEKIPIETETLAARTLRSDAAARGEVYSFQVALRSTEREYVRVELESELNCRARSVAHVPVIYAGGGGDRDVIRNNAPGLYPDLLNELDQGDHIWITANVWYVLWITVTVGENERPGKYPVTVALREKSPVATEWDKKAARVRITLDVQDFTLPEQELIRYEWFHADCLATYYKVRPWSEKHWGIVENFARNAFAHGITMLYTPLWTPPLDTAVGHQRPTCQLLEIELDLATMKYRFNFDRLRRYLAMGKKIGFRHFGMSHLFTQWGAEFTPQIVAKLRNYQRNTAVERYGEESGFASLSGDGIGRLFGWGTASTSPEYADFLRQLMPELLPVLRAEGMTKQNCFFSLSDEPGVDHLQTYSKVVALTRPLLEEFETVEALSNFDFYRNGLVQNPVPSISHIEEFRGKTKSRWAYYCCGPEGHATNRFIGMPSRRTRMLGILAYIYDLEGFLQWGFNFYYSRYSLRPIDPFACTDAGGAFPAGDPFLVYPGPTGDPLDSIRHETLRAGMQDLRALRLLEKKIGREKTLALLQGKRKKPIRMLDFPNSDSWLPSKRREIYHLLSFHEKRK